MSYIIVEQAEYLAKFSFSGTKFQREEPVFLEIREFLPTQCTIDQNDIRAKRSFIHLVVLIELRHVTDA